MDAAGSPFYQMASDIRRSLAELEIVAALGNTTRVQAVIKELEEYDRRWQARDDLPVEDRSQPPVGRATRQQRQIRTGEPDPNTATTRAGTTATAQSTTATPASTPSTPNPASPTSPPESPGQSTSTSSPPPASTPSPPASPPPPPARPASGSK